MDRAEAMLISKKMNEALNAQVGREFGAMLQYVAIAAHFAREALLVLARHFYRQADEERDHAMRFVRYIVDAGGQVAIPAVEAPKATFGSAEEAVKLSLDWELEVTRQIHALLDLAIKESDFTTQEFLQWFVREQLEEVSSMDQLLQTVRRAGERNLLLVEDVLGEVEEAEGARPDEGGT